MRTLLFTGTGGVGKTTVAAGTAALAAAAGQRTLVLSTDAAHSLADAYGVVVGPEPSEVAPGLSVLQVDTQRRFEESWRDIGGYLLSVLDAAGMDPVTAEELTVLPGAEEVLALLALRDEVVSGRWDVVVSTAPRPRRRCGCSPSPRRWGGTWTGCSRPSGVSSGPCARCWPGRPGADARGHRLRRRGAAAPRPGAGCARS